MLMKKLFTLVAMALLTMGVNAQVLINYPTSTDGITLMTTDDAQVKYSTVKIHTNKDAVDCINFGKSYKYTDSEYYYAKLSTEGGFKAGDVITIAGAFNNSDDTKKAAISFRSDPSSEEPIFTTQQFINGRTTDAEPAVETFTLSADAEALYIGRNGGTGTNITLLTIERSGSAQPEEPSTTTVGAEDNSTGWWSAFSDYYSVPAGKTLHLEFTNYSCKVDNWNNFLVVVANQERETEGYYEYFVLRADNWAWGDGKDVNVNGNSFWGAEAFTLTSNFNWDTFKDDLDGAKVVLTVTNDLANSNVLAVADIYAQSGAAYNLSFTKHQAGFPVAVADPIKVFLTTEKGHLVIDNSKTAIIEPANVSSIKTQRTAGARYNLAGQQVETGYRGVVIEDGRKFYQK